MTSAITINPKCIIKQGYLIKSPPTGEMSFIKKKWRKRWFVLTDTAALCDNDPSFIREIYLSYYKSDIKVVDGQPKGMIDLNGVAIYKQRGRLYGYDHVINIQTPNRLYHLVANQIFVCNEWLKMLQEHHVPFEEDASEFNIPRCPSSGSNRSSEYRRKSEPIVNESMEQFRSHFARDLTLKARPHQETVRDERPLEKLRAFSDNSDNRDTKPRPITAAHAAILKMAVESDDNDDSDEEYLECDSYSKLTDIPRFGTTATKNKNIENKNDAQDGDEEVYDHLVFDKTKQTWKSQSCKKTFDSNKFNYTIDNWQERKSQSFDVSENRSTWQDGGHHYVKEKNGNVESCETNDEVYENIEIYNAKYESEDEGIGRTDSESSSTSTSSTTSTFSTTQSPSLSIMQEALANFRPRDERHSVAFDHFTGPKFTSSRTSTPTKAPLSRARSVGDVSLTAEHSFVRTKQYEF